ncbi:hypothetical protein [Pseudomonas aeruginosa]|uniref:hypothetical protein n=1 Tax=Pseudomonas aeruginosa TaxID=287 RepID=UPI002954DD61|nr:hypothetical protein [Pseudomonas aeruginosa]MDV7847758.1 hypothetical protein [Pseudomonas aeruginosa]
MSDVTRYNFDTTACWYEHPDGEFVEHDAYAKLAAEAQALREEVARGNRITLAMALDIAAVGVALGIPGEQQEGGTGEFIEAIQNLQKELEALRARVLVLPDASTVYAALDARERLFTSPENIQVALEAQSRLNGKTVSEGLLRGMGAFAQEIISGALEGGNFDGAELQESAERHGLIAKQVMREPCRGPEEYCACAWSTSFPTECYRITAELRALLSEQEGRTQ